MHIYLSMNGAHSLVPHCSPPSKWKKLDDSRERERERETGGERERQIRGPQRLHTNTSNVSKTFRDGRTRIDENPILITEPRPARVHRAASRMHIDRGGFSSCLFSLPPRDVIPVDPGCRGGDGSNILRQSVARSYLIIPTNPRVSRSGLLDEIVCGLPMKLPFE